MAPSVEVNLVQVRDDAVNQVHRNMGDDAPARSAPAHTAASLCDAITDSLSWPDHTDAFAVLGDTPVDRVMAHTLAAAGAAQVPNEILHGRRKSHLLAPNHRVTPTNSMTRPACSP